jgi:hypothetical protein
MLFDGLDQTGPVIIHGEFLTTKITPESLASRNHGGLNTHLCGTIFAPLICVLVDSFAQGVESFAAKMKTFAGFGIMERFHSFSPPCWFGARITGAFWLKSF